MFRSVLLLLVAVFALVPDAWAVQLGDSREQIVGQYGPPTAGNLDSNQGMGIYRWTGWRLDVEVIQGAVQRLIFTKDSVPFSEAEERQLLYENGGVTFWQPVDHVAVDAMAVKKWRRATDGAEAFTLAGEPRVMCLVTRVWADAWAKVHPVNSQQRNVAGTPNRATVAKSASDAPGPLAYFFAGLVVLAGCVGIVGLLGFAAWKFVHAVSKRRVFATPAGNGLWIPPPLPTHLKSACLIATPPPLASIPHSLPISNVPRPKTLEDLSWQEFELLVGELYRRQGYGVEMCSGDGSDGGVDLWLRKDRRTTLVQCKHWKVYKVGVSPVRELFGILSAEKADHAILVTTGKFTQDAKAFAAGKPMQLIAGDQLRVAVEASKYSAEGDLLDVVRWSSTFAQSATITTPVCPFCRSSMVLRRGKQSGNQFWGCSTFPGCRGKRNVRPELMRA